MAATETMQVEVIYALPETQQLRRLTVPVGSKVEVVLALSGLHEAHPELRTTLPLKLAVFGRLVGTETVLREGDRLEVLRDLLADPKDSRRARVKAQRRAARP